MKYTKAGGTVGFRIIQKGHAPEGFADYDFVVKDNGIGMAITKNIVDMMGGTIKVKSELRSLLDLRQPSKTAREAGVTAFCAKPLFVSELYDVLQNASRPVKTKDKTILEVEAFKGKEILLVEDVELNREIAETILTEAGFHVNSVEDGKQAVDYMESEKGDMIDLILMDVMMPVMDGYEATQKIRQLEDKTKADIPIIAMTANAFEEDAKAAIEAGMNAHMAKPIRIESLYEIIEQYL